MANPDRKSAMPDFVNISRFKPRRIPLPQHLHRRAALAARAFQPSAIEVGPGWRQTGGAAPLLRCERLVQADGVALERYRAGGEIDQPNPRLHLADLAHGGVVIGEQP